MSVKLCNEIQREHNLNLKHVYFVGNSCWLKFLSKFSVVGIFVKTQMGLFSTILPLGMIDEMQLDDSSCVLAL